MFHCEKVSVVTTEQYIFPDIFNPAARSMKLYEDPMYMYAIHDS